MGIVALFGTPCHILYCIYVGAKPVTGTELLAPAKRIFNTPEILQDEENNDFSPFSIYESSCIFQHSEMNNVKPLCTLSSVGHTIQVPSVMLMHSPHTNLCGRRKTTVPSMMTLVLGAGLGYVCCCM